jgi:very-short-patch-repair endonuclease
VAVDALKEFRNSERTKWEDAFIGLVRIHKLPKPESQYKFHPERGWKSDFAYPSHRLLIEIEGGIWRRGGGAHSHPSNILRDIEKYNAAALLGFYVLRFSDREIKDQSCIETVRNFLETHPIA